MSIGLNIALGLIWAFGIAAAGTIVSGDSLASPWPWVWLGSGLIGWFGSDVRKWYQGRNK